MVVLFLRRPTTVVAMLCWLLSAPPSRLFDGMVELETFPIMIFTYPQAPQCISNSSVGGMVYLLWFNQWSRYRTGRNGSARSGRGWRGSRVERGSRSGRERSRERSRGRESRESSSLWFPANILNATSSHVIISRQIDSTGKYFSRQISSQIFRRSQTFQWTMEVKVNGQW